MLLQRLPRRTSRTCLKTHLTLHRSGPSGPVSIVQTQSDMTRLVIALLTVLRVLLQTTAGALGDAPDQR